jgi:ABC-type antimicrobial peptide transport system permease subunit
MGADPREPLVYGIVAGVLGLTGALAVSLPARRALSVNVVEAIRTE